MANFDEFDAESQALLNNLQQSNKFLSFEDLNKGFPDNETFNSFSARRTFDHISRERAENSFFGTESIFNEKKEGEFIYRYINKTLLAEDIIYYTQKKSIMKYRVFKYNDGVKFSEYIIIDNEEYDVKTEINMLSGYIDFSQNPIFRFSFNLKEQKANFQILYEFKEYKNSADVNRIAIKLTFDKYIDFEFFLNKLGKQIIEKSKINIENEFTKAFLLANKKSEILDFIYETAPDFVLISRDVKLLFEDLKLLSSKTIDSLGTNENISITNIIDAINKKNIYEKKWFFDQINSNPEAIRMLFEKLNKKHIEKIIFLTSSIGYNFWKKDELKKAWDYTIDYSEFKAFKSSERNYYDSYTLYTGFAYYLKDKKRYKVGTAIFGYNDSSSLLPDLSREIGPNDLKLPFEPMRLKLEKGELYIPCFVAEYFTNKKIDEEWWTILNNFVPLILIETTAAVRGASVISKLFSSGKKIKTIDELILFLDKVDESVLATDLEKVGIEVLFRGTTRNVQGELFAGNTNSILNGTSTSTDPIRAVIFGIESSSKPGTKGVLQIYVPKDLKGLNLLAPNRRINIELEVIVNTSPENLSNFTMKEIPIEEARKLVNEMYGVDIPKTITNNTFPNSEFLLKETKKLTPKESLQFYNKIIK